MFKLRKWLFLIKNKVIVKLMEATPLKKVGTGSTPQCRIPSSFVNSL